MTKWRAGIGLATAASRRGRSSRRSRARRRPPRPSRPRSPPGVIAPGVSHRRRPRRRGHRRRRPRRGDRRSTSSPAARRSSSPSAGRNLAIDPVKAGYAAKVDYAVKVALHLRAHARPCRPTGVVDVPLAETVNTKKLRAILNLRAARQRPVRRGRRRLPEGRHAGRPQAARRHRRRRRRRRPTQIAAAIVTRDRPALRPGVARASPPPAPRSAAFVVIDRGNYRLTWYKGKKKLTLPDRGRPARLPDAHRRLPGHPEAGEPHLVPAELPVGRGPRPGPARA